MNDSLANLLAELKRSVHWVTGYFTAIQTSPGILKPGHWLNTSQRQTLRRYSGGRRMLLEYFAEVGEGLKTDIKSICPHPSDEAGVAEFCRGYLDAVRSDARWGFDESDGSDDSEDDADPKLAVLFTFQTLAGELSRRDLAAHMNSEQLDRFRSSERSRIVAYVSYLYTLCAGDRRGQSE